MGAVVQETEVGFQFVALLQGLAYELRASFSACLMSAVVMNGVYHMASIGLARESPAIEHDRMPSAALLSDNGKCALSASNAEQPMRLTFYERVGLEGRRPSPFSWRIRYALAHKGIDFDVHPVRFADVETIRRLSGQHLTPIIDDNGKVTHETWDIANYLEDQFPNRPSLFGGAAGKGMARFINLWSDMQLAPPLRRVIYADF